MTGAEAALRAAAGAGVELCLANPGTTELDFVAALDRVPSIRPVLGLFEGVVTGAADGYGRIARRPALTLLHLGPGLANGLANLHNARRASTPIVNLVGDHASWHRSADAPLTSDIAALARPMSIAVRTVDGAADLARALPEAVATALGPPSGPVTVVVPQDAAWDEVPAAAPALDPSPVQDVVAEPDLIAMAAATLREHGRRAALLLGGAIDAGALVAASAIAGATGCSVWTETFPAVVAAGAAAPAIPALPYFPQDAIAALADLDVLVAVGAPPPVAFFGYASVGRSSVLSSGCRVIELIPPGSPIDPTLDGLVAAIDAGSALHSAVRTRPELPTGSLDARSLGAALAALQPEDAIVVCEAATSSTPWLTASAGAPPHDVLTLTGGAIGFGLPNAVGAALAAPDRKVIALQADGSAMYTAQALWTMAHEDLDITVVLCANDAYRILQVELHRTLALDEGPARQALTDLTGPRIEWATLATSMGVPAIRATTADELVAALRTGLGRRGPFLVEAQIA